ncbi:hypothetical protein [Saccharopolyspora erythraea]|uniref:hypothetical protein n=1 Tax=Saccharopolyspora erythraea TaxID=1836 RepID=UPI002012C09C|nr:hypothetical protein [Saccharopolyspora erythraea]
MHRAVATVIFALAGLLQLVVLVHMVFGDFDLGLFAIAFAALTTCAWLIICVNSACSWSSTNSHAPAAARWTTRPTTSRRVG